MMMPYLGTHHILIGTIDHMRQVEEIIVETVMNDEMQIQIQEPLCHVGTILDQMGITVVELFDEVVVVISCQWHEIQHMEHVVHHHLARYQLLKIS